MGEEVEILSFQNQTLLYGLMGEDRESILLEVCGELLE
jgi:hypothetical protein